MRLRYAMGLLLLPATALAQSGLSPDQQLAREIFKQLIEINTSHSVGSTTTAANAMAARLTQAGFPAADVQVIGLAGSKNFNLVARYRGTGARKPVLFLAHLDVVEALRADWSVDPFVFLEKDGFFYGRGTMDIKDGAAILVTTFIRLKQQGYRPDRDLILALTAGEEGGGDYNGVDWLIKNHRELIDAAYTVNMDAGDPQIIKGKRLLRTVQAAEKVSVSFQVEVHNPGGHSSLPTKDNAIYRLAAGLVRVGAYEFPTQLSEITRTYFQRMAALQQGQLAADMEAASRATPDSAAVRRLSDSSPFYNAQFRTTCVATELLGGHARNALPQMARATINCRILPGVPVEDVERTLVRVMADSQIVLSRLSQPQPSPASPLTPEVMGPIEGVTRRMWNIPVVPILEVGATDGRLLRNAGIPTYGASGVFIDVDDVRAHGKDERIGVRDFYDGVEHIYQLTKALSSPVP